MQLREPGSAGRVAFLVLMLACRSSNTDQSNESAQQSSAATSNYAAARQHFHTHLVKRNSSLPEVGGDAALYIDEPTADGIARALTETLADRVALAARGEASRAHVSQFAWSHVAEQTLAVYREAMRG